ncbi:MAG: hypothetical protein Q9190_000863 [Brigantiaea leucoxantha]
MSEQNPPVKIAPPPWKCRYTAYVGAFYLSTSSELPRDLAYDPIEASSSVVTDTLKWKGGIAMIQLLRYNETPVGPYDEIAIMPGGFQLPNGDTHSSVTRIYVSQRDTCYNGRKNWNIPKHLARFEYTGSFSKPPFSVSIFPASSDDHPASTAPFFTASIAPLRFWTPSFPFSTNFAKHVGISNVLLQPPLPEGEPKDVTPGSEQFFKTDGHIWCKKAKLVWFDMKQPEGAVKVVKGRENWWPGFRRWNLGLWLPDAELSLGDPDVVKI